MFTLVGMLCSHGIAYVCCKLLSLRKRRLERRKQRLMRELLKYEYLNGVEENEWEMGR